jgi:hypothetical protein
MVVTVEAWLVADSDALKKFYGKGFKLHSIMKQPKDVEQYNKALLASALNSATKNTSKGEYHKIHHCGKLLAELNTGKVRQASFHCERLFTTLVDKFKLY